MTVKATVQQLRKGIVQIAVSNPDFNGDVCPNPKHLGDSEMSAVECNHKDEHRSASPPQGH